MPNNKVDANVLKQIHLFKPLDESRLEQVIKTTQVINLSEGKALFSQNQRAEYFYLVVAGQIKLFRASDDGNEKVIELVNAGRVFAEAIMFMERNFYPVNASAIQHSVLYRFRSKIYLDLLRDSSDLCFALFADLSSRLHGLLTEIDQLALQNASHRVVQYLIELLANSNTNIVQLNANKRTIASRLSITPETLSRIFRVMIDEGIISINGKTIKILDLQRLHEFNRYSASDA